MKITSGDFFAEAWATAATVSTYQHALPEAAMAPCRVSSRGVVPTTSISATLESGNDLPL
jgi:hypothetical protein